MILFWLLQNLAFGQIVSPFAYWKCSSASAIISSTDTTNADFSAGTFSSTIVTGSTVSLAVAATSGTFTSRTVDILQSCSPFVNFNTFSWKSSIPYYKELPTTAESIADYPSVLTTLNTNLIGYWRFNETAIGGVTGGKDFRDYSGNNNHATKTGTITLGASGSFWNAISSNNTGGYVDLPGVNALIANTSSYTMSVWIKSTSFIDGCSGAGTYILDRALSGGGNPLAGICTVGGNYAFESRCDNGTSLQQVNGPVVVTGTWQHVVIQRDRASALYRIFGNGVQINTAADGGGCAVTLDPPRLGRHATGTTQGLNGSADEMIIWNRALSAAEILQLYRRGGNRVEFQVRACMNSACSDNPSWIGPDGTSATYFSELNNNSVPLTGTGSVTATFPTMTFTSFPSVVFPRKRFFQYKAYLNSNSTANTPDFNWTKVGW